MNKQTAEELAKMAAKEAVKEYKKEQEKNRKRTALHNAKLLMSNYNILKMNVEEGISDISQVDFTSLKDIYSDEDVLYIESIRRSKIRSLIMITHIEKCLELLKADLEKKDELDKYKVFIEVLVEQKTHEDVAEANHIVPMTVYRWVNELLRKLSVYLFGIDSLTLKTC